MLELDYLHNIGGQITLVTIWLVVILLIAETIHRFYPNDVELSRKIVHIGTGNVILIAWWLAIPAWLGVAAGVVSAMVALISYKIPILPSINSVGRHSLGTFFYGMSVSILIAVFFGYFHQPEYAVLGILIMTWGDGLAGLIGQKFGRNPYQIWGSKKSWEGSFTMLLVSFVISLIILLVVHENIWPIWLEAIGLAIVATMLECFAKLGIDNLTVPLIIGILSFSFERMFFY